MEVSALPAHIVVRTSARKMPPEPKKHVVKCPHVPLEVKKRFTDIVQQQSYASNGT